VASAAEQATLEAQRVRMRATTREETLRGSSGGRLLPQPSCACSLEAQRVRMRAGKEERNTLALSAARLIPRPSCACSLDAPRAVRSIPRPSYASALEQPAAAFAPAEQIAPADYQRFADLIYQTCGIHMNASKRLMVETRLRKRLRATGLKTFREYWKRLHDPTDQGVELVLFIDAMTTNKTEFFREPVHFVYLTKKLLPAIGQRAKQAARPVRVWSAGCSTGKEAYTLAMVLSECRERGEVGDFEILGTDISTEVLGKARRAVYEPEEIEPIPEALRKKYLLRRRGDGGGRFRIAPELRARVRFERLNFMDNGFRLEALFDIIFCRNVIIYFDRETQAKVVNKLVESLDPQGYFFTGHSETLSGFATQLVSVAPTIYRKGKKT